MTIDRRLVGALCVLAAATACSGSHDSAHTPTTFHPKTTLSLRPLLGAETQTGACPADKVPALVSGTCYRVGPAFITQADIATADATYDDGIGKWVIIAEVAKSARPRYLHQMTNVLVNREVAIVIDNRVVNQVEVHTGVSSADFEIASRENWSMTKAIETAAGIAKPSRPPCTARTCPTSTGEGDRIAARCDRVAPSLGYVGSTSSEGELSAGALRAAFVRAHEQVPGVLERVEASEHLALCSFTKLSSPNRTTPTSTCPGGVVIPVATNYAVDTNLQIIPRVPAARYLYPDGQPPGLDPCDLVASGP